MSKFTLHEYFCQPLTYAEFQIAKQKYFESIDNNNFRLSASGNVREIIQSVKRENCSIGPYQNLSVFEILNRIGSDLVLLSGVEKLFRHEIATIKPLTILICMGNIAGFDLIIKTEDGEIINGEAFNAAMSFCKKKMRHTIAKLLKPHNVQTTKRAVILVNSDVKDALIAYKNLNLKNIESVGNFKIHKLFCEV